VISGGAGYPILPCIRSLDTENLAVFDQTPQALNLALLLYGAVFGAGGSIPSFPIHSSPSAGPRHGFGKQGFIALRGLAAGEGAWRAGEPIPLDRLALKQIFERFKWTVKAVRFGGFIGSNAV